MPFKSLLNAHILQTHRLSRSRSGLDLKSSRAKNRDNPDDITLTKSQDVSASTSLQQHVFFFFRLFVVGNARLNFLCLIKSCFLWRFLWRFLWCTLGLLWDQKLAFEALVLKPSSSNGLVQGTGFHLVVIQRPPGPYSQILEEFCELIADLVTFLFHLKHREPVLVPVTQMFLFLVISVRQL